MPDPTSRKRKLHNHFDGEKRSRFNGGAWVIEKGSKDFSGTQHTVSEGHQVSLLGKTDGDIGGDFYSYKSEVVYVSHPYMSVATPPGTLDYAYTGIVYPAGVSIVNELDVPLRSIQSLNALGATAISRCSPVDSQAEALTSVSETLKDGLPAIAGISTWRDRAHISKGAGSEYLNAQFGWVPLISDVKAVANSYKNAAKILAQLKRDSGRTVRRTYEFPTEHSHEVIEDRTSGSPATSLVGWHGSMGSQFFSGDLSGHYVRERDTKVKTWFSGAFTYYMPADDSQIGKLVSAYQMYDHLYGTGLTPDVLWNLTPWSWATDWFANTGDVLANVSNAMMYGQILRYGYVMEQTTILDRYSLKADTFRGGPGPYSVVVKTTVKRRIRANPFGFGITYDGLDAYQLSILAALGMTKR